MKGLDLAFRIEQFGSVGSTQAVLREQLLAGKDIHGLVVRADTQERGYGRRGSTWLAGPGGSYQSIGVRDGDAARLQTGSLPLALAMSIAQTFRAYGAQVDVKWPNDLWYRGKKLGGILGEYLAKHVLVGVGVNVANSLPPNSTALRGWDLDGVHGAVLRGVQEGLDVVLREEPLAEAFAGLDALAAQDLSVEMPDGESVRGRSLGIRDDGCLLVDTGERVVIVGDGHIRLR